MVYSYEADVIVQSYSIREKDFCWLRQSSYPGYVIQCSTQACGGWRIVASSCNSLSSRHGWYFAKVVPPGVLNYMVMQETAGLELTGLAYALHHWTDKLDLKGKQILVQCDNMEAVKMLNEKIVEAQQPPKPRRSSDDNDNEDGEEETEIEKQKNKALMNILLKKVHEIGFENFELSHYDQNSCVITDALAKFPVEEKDRVAFQGAVKDLQMLSCEKMTDDFFYYVNSMVEALEEEEERKKQEEEAEEERRQSEEKEGVLGVIMMVFGLIIFLAIITTPFAIGIMIYKHWLHSQYVSPGPKVSNPGATGFRKYYKNQ